MAKEWQSVEESALIDGARRGDPDAFRELSARYLGLLQARAAGFGGRGAPERDDLLQEGLVGLYLAAMTYDESRGASFRTYAAVCVRNRMADAARRHASPGNRWLNESLSLDSEAASQAAEEGPEGRIELREQVRSLLDRLDRTLSPLEKKALTLYLSGCPRSEIESRSGLTLKAYDNALYRVRGKLKRDD